MPLVDNEGSLSSIHEYVIATYLEPDDSTPFSTVYFHIFLLAKSGPTRGRYPSDFPIIFFLSRLNEVTVQVGLELRIWASILEMLNSNPGWDTGYPGRIFEVPHSPSSKYRNNTPIRPRPLPSKSFLIHHHLSTTRCYTVFALKRSLSNLQIIYTKSANANSWRRVEIIKLLNMYFSPSSLGPNFLFSVQNTFNIGSMFFS
jgi:hypothetical protein